MRRWKDGREIGFVDLHNYHHETYGAPFWDIHRHDLIVALFDRAKKLGADIRVNTKVIDIDFAQATVHLEDQTSLCGDLVVGADGLNSLCRKRLVPTEEPEHTGDIAFRVLLNYDELPDDSDFRELVTKPQVTYWLGHNGHVIVYILKQGKQINLVAVAPDDLPSGVIRAPCDVSECTKIFREWDPLINKLISHKNVIWKWKLHKRPELDRWNHPSGRFTLIGDAVHPTLPYLSQGAAITVEDAAVLGQVLTEPISLSAALAKYEALRKPRTTEVVRAATRQQGWYHLPDGEKQQMRDAMIGAPMSMEGDPFLWREPTFAPWLYGYDAYAEAKKQAGQVNGFANGSSN
ncbi:FAD binding domain-containing protein [Cladophialophora immunda]|nr:FAD binding domain-containing protein [Cladophialophora immunda]